MTQENTKTQKYKLFIPFKLKSYGKLETKDSNNKIKINDLNYSIKYSDDFKIHYFCIESFNTEESALRFYENFKILLKLILLNDSRLIFKLNENVNHAKKVPWNINQPNGYKYIAKYNETSLFPLTEPIYLLKTGKFGFYSNIIPKDITKSIKNIISEFDLNKIRKNDKKMNLILDIYSQSKQESPKSRFLSLINIIEILQENEKKSKKYTKVNKKLLKYIDKLKKDIKKDNKISNEDKKEYEEILKKYSSDIGKWKSRKTIDKYLNKLKEKNNINIDSYKDNLNKAFKIRNKMVHGNKYINVDENFYKSLNFLNKLIESIIKIELEEYKI